MTRINVVPVAELYDQHLMAEYRELPRVFTYTESLIQVPEDIPNDFTLGKGHVKFFSNKLTFLLNRQSELVNELQKRGFNISFNLTELTDRYDKISNIFKNDYEPPDQALALSRQRISERLADKPLWYKKSSYITEPTAV